MSAPSHYTHRPLLCDQGDPHLWSFRFHRLFPSGSLTESPSFNLMENQLIKPPVPFQASPEQITHLWPLLRAVLVYFKSLIQPPGLGRSPTLSLVLCWEASSLVSMFNVRRHLFNVIVLSHGLGESVPCGFPLFWKAVLILLQIFFLYFCSCRLKPTCPQSSCLLVPGQ